MIEWRKQLRLLLALLSLLYVSGSQSDHLCDPTEGICTEEHQEEYDSHNNNHATCGIWFAKSSIPNAGLGMYAGRHFDQGEDMAASGDVVIPIVDIEMHQGRGWLFLWDSYVWDCPGNDGIKEVSFASPGFGSAANSFIDLHNVDELGKEQSLAGLHRSKDPGAGAFSPYHNRRSIAKMPIPVGQELFMNCELKSVL